MQRPNLSREELLKILNLNRPWIPITPGVSPEPQIRRDGSMKVFLTLMDRVVEVAADRLQDPDATGPVLRIGSQDLIALASDVGIIDFSEFPVSPPDSLYRALLCLNLISGPIDFTITTQERWTEIQAVVTLAASYHITPEQFLTYVSSASELVLQMTHSPESYRQREQDRFDARHPDVLRRYYNAVEREIAVLRTVHPGLRDRPVHLNWSLPSESEFWMRRAWWMTQVEQRIDHVWPGHSLGSTRNLQGEDVS